MPDRNKVVISGTLGDNDEANWSVGAYFGSLIGGNNAVETVGDLQAWATAIGAGIQIGGFISADLEAGLSASGQTTEVTCYYYPDGATQALAVAGAAAIQVGTGTVSNPAQTSVVASLRTGISGRSFRGRTYWPALGYGLTGSLKFTASVPGLVASGIKALWSSVADEAGLGDFGLVVYSATRDVLTPVSSIAVGDVPDTQRRRRDNLVEQYATVTYP